MCLVLDTLLNNEASDGLTAEPEEAHHHSETHSSREAAFLPGDPPHTPSGDSTVLPECFCDRRWRIQVQTAQLCRVAGRSTPGIGGQAQKYKWRPLAYGGPWPMVHALLSPPPCEGYLCMDNQPAVTAPLPAGWWDQAGRGNCRGPGSGFWALY